jgi:hypothetical protein
LIHTVKLTFAVQKIGHSITARYTKSSKPDVAFAIFLKIFAYFMQKSLACQNLRHFCCRQRGQWPQKGGQNHPRGAAVAYHKRAGCSARRDNVAMRVASMCQLHYKPCIGINAWAAQPGSGKGHNPHHIHHLSFDDKTGSIQQTIPNFLPPALLPELCAKKQPTSHKSGTQHNIGKPGSFDCLVHDNSSRQFLPPPNSCHEKSNIHAVTAAPREKIRHASEQGRTAPPQTRARQYEFLANSRRIPGRRSSPACAGGGASFKGAPAPLPLSRTGRRQNPEFPGLHALPPERFGFEAASGSVVTSAFSGISASNFAFYSGRVPSEYTPCIKGSFSLRLLKIHHETTLPGEMLTYSVWRCYLTFFETVVDGRVHSCFKKNRALPNEITVRFQEALKSVPP